VRTDSLSHPRGVAPSLLIPNQQLVIQPCTEREGGIESMRGGEAGKAHKHERCGVGQVDVCAYVEGCMRESHLHSLSRARHCAVHVARLPHPLLDLRAIHSHGSVVRTRAGHRHLRRGQPHESSTQHSHGECGRHHLCFFSGTVCNS
jgi:hypothetical protein